jgi:hypothetical protein
MPDSRTPVIWKRTTRRGTGKKAGIEARITQIKAQAEETTSGYPL